MTQFSPAALEEAAKALDPDAWDSKASGVDDRREDARIMATAAITAYLAQREKEGFVEVPVSPSNPRNQQSRRSEKMKLSASVHEVKSSGDRLCLVLRAQLLPSESVYSTVLHEIEIPNTEKARKTYYVGRTVEVGVVPR